MKSTTEAHQNAPRGLVLAAFAAIYLIWGSTYLGIRFAVETIPPFILGGARFLLAGAILYAWLRFKGVPNPSIVHWRNAAIVGVLLLGVGNGGVNWAEQKLASSLTALLIAITPLWFVLLDWLRPRGTILGEFVGRECAGPAGAKKSARADVKMEGGENCLRQPRKLEEKHVPTSQHLPRAG